MRHMISLTLAALGILSTGCGADGGSAAAPGGAGAGGQPQGDLPPCITQASQGVIIGDSYVTGFSSPPMQPVLDGLMKAEGAVTGYRNYAVAGTSLGAGGIGLIPPQFDQALKEDPNIRLVIMDGGGNDVLLQPAGPVVCKNLVGSSKDPVCQGVVQTALDAATALMNKAVAAGVKDVVYFFYPAIPPNASGLAGSNPNELLDYAYPLAAHACDTAFEVSGGKLRCHWIDLRQPWIAGGGDFVADGVHPGAAGQAVIAGQVWATMKADCLGQPASAGCCAP